MFNKFTLIVAAMLCIAGIGRAQSELQPCGADEHYQKMLVKYPQLAEYEKQFEDQLGRRMAERTTATVDTAIYDVPIVIHVIHDYGDENLPDTVLYDAAAYWSIVYMKENADTADVITPFIPYVGKPGMRLHLATKDPNGNPTKGIVRFNSYLTQTADDEAKFGGWPQNQYVNIWFINTFGPDLSGVAAYAYFPSEAIFEPYYDGIICLASYANYGKTVPHEMGHVMNLYHPWGNTNNPGVACGGTDHVDDTPPTKGHLPSSGCSFAALYDTACANGYMMTYLSSDGTMDSVVNYPDTTNAQNIMDYTYCQKMFTKGQAARMRTALTSSTGGRNNLYSAANLAATGALAPMPDLPPVADFYVYRGSPATSDLRAYFLTFNNTTSFNFRNASWNDTISSVAWSFSNGATNPTSTAMTGSVANQFSVPGWVTVSLTATSNAGSNTIVNPQTVYAADTTPVGGMGYFQSFSNASDLSNWPMFNFYNNQFKWEFYTGAGIGDNSCIRYRSYDSSNRITGNAVGDHDDFYTPAFNLTNNPDNLYLNFYTTSAYTNHNIPGGTTLVNDSMEVDASVNGGANWYRIGGYGGSRLTNVGNYGYEFVPNSATPWIPRAISIPASYRTAQTFFRFRYHPGNTGNDMYLDNLNFDGFPAGIKDAIAAAPNSFSIFPNPSSNGFNLVFKTGNSGSVSYSIKDLTGKVVYTNTKAFAANSMQQESVPRSATPAAGMYFVTIAIDGVNMTQKLVVY